MISIQKTIHVFSSLRIVARGTPRLLLLRTFSARDPVWTQVIFNTRRAHKSGCAKELVRESGELESAARSRILLVAVAKLYILAKTSCSGPNNRFLSLVFFVDLSRGYSSAVALEFLAYDRPRSLFYRVSPRSNSQTITCQVLLRHLPKYC